MVSCAHLSNVQDSHQGVHRSLWIRSCRLLARERQLNSWTKIEQNLGIEQNGVSFLFWVVLSQILSHKSYAQRTPRRSLMMAVAFSGRRLKTWQNIWRQTTRSEQHSSTCFNMSLIYVTSCGKDLWVDSIWLILVSLKFQDIDSLTGLLTRPDLLPEYFWLLLHQMVWSHPRRLPWDAQSKSQRTSPTKSNHNNRITTVTTHITLIPSQIDFWQDAMRNLWKVLRLATRTPAKHCLPCLECRFVPTRSHKVLCSMASICCTRCGAVFKRTVMGSVPQCSIEAVTCHRNTNPRSQIKSQATFFHAIRPPQKFWQPNELVLIFVADPDSTFSYWQVAYWRLETSWALWPKNQPWLEHIRTKKFRCKTAKHKVSAFTAWGNNSFHLVSDLETWAIWIHLA